MQPFPEEVAQTGGGGIVPHVVEVVRALSPVGCVGSEEDPQAALQDRQGKIDPEALL